MNVQCGTICLYDSVCDLQIFCALETDIQVAYNNILYIMNRMY